MKQKFLAAAGGTILLLLFPYLVTLFAGGSVTEIPAELPESGRIILRETTLGREEIDLEVYAVGAAAAQIPGDYEKEAVKAQLIIVRTYLYKRMGEAAAVEENALGCAYLSEAGRRELWGEQYDEYAEKFAEASAETAGQVMTCDDLLIDAVFHRASAGMTRDGGEAYPYLRTVDSSQDIDMVDYVTILEISAEDLADAITGIRGQKLTGNELSSIQITARDGAGYVEQVIVGTEEYTGEELAAALSLPSPAFSIEQTERGLRFVVKGSGHGYGLSQWGANKLAMDGADAASILSRYFQNITIKTAEKSS